VIAAIILSVFFAASPVRAARQPQSPQSPATPLQETDRASGKVIFEGHCARCHGIDGSGGRGPSLQRPKLIHALDDEALKSVIENGILPEMPETWYLSKGEIDIVAAYVRELGNAPPESLPGDPLRGKAIYARSGCHDCHILGGEGFGYGPELTDIGARRGSTHLHETLRNPADTIPEDFLLVEATASSGQRIRGIRVNEDTFSIQLKDREGHFLSLRKSTLRELKKLRGETPMPSYTTALSPAEQDDLVAFLASQRGTP
jgi:putative heme-binding domain-containing protein